MENKRAKWHSYHHFEWFAQLSDKTGIWITDTFEDTCVTQRNTGMIQLIVSMVILIL